MEEDVGYEEFDKPIKYNIMKPWETLDPWQEAVLATEGNIVLRSGRQVGKSTVVSIKAGEFAMKNPKKTIMVVASVERSAYLLFEKILSYIHARNYKCIAKGKNRPTKSKLTLKNGSKILCLPTGDSGYGIRGHTIDLLIADEAAYINEDVWTAIVPMLTVTGGSMWLLSTPHGRGGYFYDSFNDEDYTQFHVSTEEVAEMRSGVLKKNMDKFLESAKKRLTHAQYTQEILGEFVDDLKQFFKDDLITRSCIGGKSESPGIGDYFLGVDIARMGEDDTTYQIVKRKGDMMTHIYSLIEKNNMITETARQVIRLNEKWKFNKIGIDDGGLGVGVLDILLETDSTRRKVEALNNSRRVIDKDDKKVTLLKEDMYNSLLASMEQGQIILLNDDEVKASLKSIQYEYVNGKMKLSGNYSHIVEGLIRAHYIAKNKALNIWIC